MSSLYEFGRIFDENIVTPRMLDFALAEKVKYISSGSTHSLILIEGGKIFSRGYNMYGQLGSDDTRPRINPEMIEYFKEHVITQICCGSSHSVVLDENGGVHTFGLNSFQQLGHGLSGTAAVATTHRSIPKLVNDLASKVVVQIASGNHHNIALTNEGDLFSWGLNNSGQCGLGNTKDKVFTPTKITSLNGIPIAFIACGGSHTYVISKSGAVYGFGKNLWGQLGVDPVKYGIKSSNPYPIHLTSLQNLDIRHIVAGEDFSVFVTQEGQVLACGSGSNGQLGNGNNIPRQHLPMAVIEMMGNICTQVAAGRQHVLTFVNSPERIFGFGLGSSGQLGNGSTKYELSPKRIMTESLVSKFVKRIFAGENCSFVSTTDSHASNYDCRIFDSNTQIGCATVDLIDQCTRIGENDPVNQQLLSSMETTFNSLPCMNGSFLHSQQKCCSMKNHGINMDDATTSFALIQKIKNQTLKDVIWNGITDYLLPALEPKAPPSMEALRIYLLLPLYHEFSNVKNYALLHTKFGEKLLTLTEIPRKIISFWLAGTPIEYFDRTVKNFKNVVEHLLRTKLHKININNNLAFVDYNKSLFIALNVLEILFDINQSKRTAPGPRETFQIESLEKIVDIASDYAAYVDSQDEEMIRRCLFNYPFVFDARAKKFILNLEQQYEMTSQAFPMGNTNSTHQHLLILNISRNNIVEDTIKAIDNINDAQELKRQLVVQFDGETGVDYGGLKKEFFLLISEQLFSEQYGMFKADDESHMTWFLDTPFQEDLRMFNLLGTLVGLAIYNFQVISYPFPLAFYKKILNEPPNLDDLHEFSPTIGNSIKSLLEYNDDDIEDVFCLTFEYTRKSVYGQSEVIPLKEGGDKILVNQSNKKEYVDLYIDYFFNKSVAKQFEKFLEGFRKVCNSPAMHMFCPQELRLVTNGGDNYNWDLFENNATYGSGYNASHKTIRLFWKVFHEQLSTEDKKKFLIFVTASDRFPYGDITKIKIKRSNYSDETYLPIAHTCFNQLELPKYKTEQQLKSKLLEAIQHYKQFSLA